MLNLLETTNTRIEVEEKTRAEEVASIKDFGNGLQNQINMLDKYNKDMVQSDIDKGQEDLLSSKYLNLKANYSQKTSDYPEPTFETDASKINWN